MGVILDSSVLIAAERKRFDLVGFLSAHANDTIFITAITASELLHGCERATDPVIACDRKHSTMVGRAVTFPQLLRGHNLLMRFLIRVWKWD